MLQTGKDRPSHTRKWQQKLKVRALIRDKDCRFINKNECYGKLVLMHIRDMEHYPDLARALRNVIIGCAWHENKYGHRLLDENVKSLWGCRE